MKDKTKINNFIFTIAHLHLASSTKYVFEILTNRLLEQHSQPFSILFVFKSISIFYFLKLPMFWDIYVPILIYGNRCGRIGAIEITDSVWLVTNMQNLHSWKRYQFSIDCLLTSCCLCEFNVIFLSEKFIHISFSYPDKLFHFYSVNLQQIEKWIVSNKFLSDYFDLNSLNN